MPASNRKIVISVIGSHELSDKVERIAHEIGKLIAKMGAILVCGGLGGAMQQAAKGAKEGGGITIGILPGREKADANPFIDIALPTSIGYARNAIVACAADIIIALPGSHGTLSEICYGMVFGRPVIDLGGWAMDGMIPVRGLQETEETLSKLVEDIKKRNARTSGSRND